MRKALLPIWASLLIGGTCTAALVVGAQAASKPATVVLAQADAAPLAETRTDAPPAMVRGARHARFCENLVARKAAKIAFVETKLQLTPAQTPLFGQWKQVTLDTARRHEAECTARAGQPRARTDAVERLNRQEARLKRRLADIEAERPALTALYASLTPEQRKDFTRGEHKRRGGHMGGRMHGMMGMMGHRGMGHRFGRGPDGAMPTPPAQ